MPLINFEVNFILNWHEEYVTSPNSLAPHGTTFTIIDVKL